MKRNFIALLLCGTALTMPSRAQAMPPVVSAVSFLVGGAGFGAVTSIFGFAAGTVGFTIASAALRIGGSLLLSSAARALGPKPPRPPGAPELIREFETPQSITPKRFVYGNARIYGSPTWRVKGKFLYGCLILNSRPSHAFTGIHFDKRAIPLVGNPYDFLGGGMVVPSGDPLFNLVNVWVGRGDQVAPPSLIVAEAPEIFASTDAGRGLTVMWLRLNCGPNESRATIWPRTPPEVEVDGLWSKVWDPRDPTQTPTEPETWKWSANQALCTLDAARTNPIRQYPINQIDLPQFVEAANIADQSVGRKFAAPEPRYQVNGALIFNGSEIMDQILPLFAAGASQPVRVGGKLSIAPGVYSAPIATLTDITEAEGLAVQIEKPGRDLATTVTCTFTDPARDWRTSELVAYTVPGAVEADGGVPTVEDLQLPLVTSQTQAMRLQKIRAMRQRAQRQITCTLPPWAFKVVAGANVVVAFPEPYSAVNRVYRVKSANPGIFASEEGGGVAMRVPVVMEEISASDFSWNPESEEQTRAVEVIGPARQPPAPPGAISTLTGSLVAIGTAPGAIAQIRFSFDPSPSAAVVGYDWTYTRSSAGALVFSGGFIRSDVIDTSGKIFGFLSPAQLGEQYVITVRAVSSAQSTPVVSPPVTATLDQPRYVADFENGIYQIDTVPGMISNVLSLSRPSIASYVDGAGLVQTAEPNVPRIDHSAGVPCLLLEPSATNLLANSASLSTQSVMVAAQPYTLSFRGTGTVTLSGASAAGPLVGTGTGNLVQLTFTPSAGTLTLTVSGSVQFAQLEVGASVSSWIPTASGPASRAADVPSMNGVSGVLDLLATYDNGGIATFVDAPVLPGFWPTLSRQRLRSLIGTI